MERMVAETLQQATRMGAPRAIALCRCFGGVLDFGRGLWDSAEASLREAVALYRRLASASGEALSLQRLGVVLTARGRLDEARGVLEEGLFAAERAVMRSHCVTRLHASIARNRLAAEDPGGASDAMRLGDETIRRHGDCLTCNALLLPERVRTALATGGLPEAERSARALEETAARFGSRAWIGMARQARGRVELSRGRPDVAATALREARDTYRDAGQPYEAARSAVLLADAVERIGGGHGAEAAALRAEALTVFAELGAAGLEV